MYRVLYELFSDSTKFDKMRDPEWWEGILYKKGFSLGKDRYVLVTDAIEVAADQLYEDEQLRCCMPKGRAEREDQIDASDENEEVKEQK